MASAWGRQLVVVGFAIVVLSWLSPVDGRSMRWIPDTNFDDPRHWTTGRLPCRNERLRFPPSSASVFVQRNNTMLEIVLPSDGELVLAEGVVLTFPGAADNDPTCPQQDNYFNGSLPLPWFDGGNWCEANDVTSGDPVTCRPDQPRRLHSESIPCRADDVIFPSGFVVDVASGVDIRVNSIRVGQQRLVESALSQFLASDTGRRQIVRNTASGLSQTTISADGRGQCSDVTGCMCNEDFRLQEMVCTIQSPRCSPAECEEPIIPSGHCCPVCGAVLVLQYRNGFRVSDINNLVRASYQPSTSDNGIWHSVTKIRGRDSSEPDQVIQIVISDDESGGQKSVDIAYKLKETLQDEERGRQRYDVTNVRLTVSGLPLPTHSPYIGELTKEQVTAAVLVPIIAVALICLLVCLLFFTNCRRRHGNADGKRFALPSIALWRRSAEEDRDDMELGRRNVVIDNRIIFDGNLTSFDNLNFGNEQIDFDPMEVQPEGIAAGFNNPMYGTGHFHHQDVQSSSADNEVPPPKAAEAAGGRPQIAVENVYESMSKRPPQPPARVPSAAPAEPTKPASRLAGMLSGLRFDASKQKLQKGFDNELFDDNGNIDKSSSSYDQPETEAPKSKGPVVDGSSGASKGKKPKKKKATGGKKKASAGGPRGGGDKHQRLEEEDDDDDDDETQEDVENVPAAAATDEARRKKTGKAEKAAGFGNPCFDDANQEPGEPAGGRSPGAEGQTPPPTAPRPDTTFKHGFANPLFDSARQDQPGVTLEGAETKDSEA